MKNVFILSLVLCTIFFSFSCSGEKNIYQAQLADPVETDTITIRDINLYLESSISMKGYINVNTSGDYPLKETIPFLITDLDNTFDLNTDLFTYTDEAKKYPSSKENFFKQLRSGELLGGKSSKLQNIFSNIISDTQDGTINILITDNIVDLGKVDTFSEGSLVTEQIYRALLDKENLGVAIFQYLSDFNGTFYFDRKNTGGRNEQQRPFVNTTLQNRPFYVWIFGNSTLVNDLLSKNIIKDYNASHFYNVKLDVEDMGLLTEPKSGKISVNSSNNQVLINEISPEKPAKFTIGLKMGKDAGVFKDKILDSLNYVIEPNFIQSINIKTFDNSLLLENIKNKSALQKEGYTYFIQPNINDFDTTIEEFSIRLKNKKPDWIINTNLKDDLNISAENLENKTFSLLYIMDAFDKRYSEEKDLLRINMLKQ